MHLSDSTRQALIPTGKLRAVINLGNPILATLRAGRVQGPNRHSAEPSGVSVDLALELAKRLDAEVEWIIVDAALKSVESVTSEVADVGFFAIDPGRAQSIAFTAPYVLIEGCYMVRSDSPIRSNEDVDRRGVRVAVGKGSAYDLFLSRELKEASLVRAPTSPTVVAKFLEEQLDVAAGVKQQLESDAARFPSLRLLPQRFMVIRQAMGLSITRGFGALNYLARFVEDMKALGLVESSLLEHGITGASVAPPEVPRDSTS